MTTTFRLSVLLLVLASSPLWGLKSRDLALSVDVGAHTTGAAFWRSLGEDVGEEVFGQPNWFQGYELFHPTWGYSGRLGVSYFVNRFSSLDSGLELLYAPLAFSWDKDQAPAGLTLRHDAYYLRVPFSVTGYFLPLVVSTGLSFDSGVFHSSTLATGSTTVHPETTKLDTTLAVNLELGLAVDPSPTTRLVASLRGDLQLAPTYSVRAVLDEITLITIGFHLRYLWKL